jgi:hypothetical protein
MNCNQCNKKVTKASAITTAHRVVGPDIDVTGGPAETYCTTCAGNKIYELRGRISELLNAALKR